MNNFDLTKYLAEGKLHEELNGQEVKFLAQYIADAFTEEDAEGDRFSTYMTYTVGDIDGNSFELDTKATEKTPEDDAKYGTGRGWGGSFRIKPIEGGYEVRNSEKGGLVATISDQGELTMLDAEQSKAEMGGDTDYMERRRETSDYMEEGEMLDEGMLDGIKDKIVAKVEKVKNKFSDAEIEKMKSAAERALGKSAEEFTMADFTVDNIKKVGKAISALNEEQIEEGLGEKIQAIGSGLGMTAMFVGGNLAMGSQAGGIEGFVAGAIAFVLSLIVGGIIHSRNNEAQEVEEIKSNKMKKSELKEMIKAAMSENARTDAEEEGYLDGMRDEKEDMKEAEDVEVEDNEDIDVDIEKDVDVKVDDEESEVDVDIKASMPGESADVEEVQALLMKAQEAAESLGDDKLQDQIGNTITYFTRAHVAGNVSEMDDMDVNVNTTEMEAELGLEEAKDEEVKENLNESVTFPMWDKIK